MRRRFRARGALITGIILLLVAAAFYFSPEKVSLYHGKPIVFWIRQYGAPASTEQQSVAENILRQIGTNGLPAILQELQQPDQPGTQNLMRWIRRWLPWRIYYIDPYIRREQAKATLVLLRTNMGERVLLELMGHTNRSVRAAAGYATSQLTQGRQILLDAFESTNPWVQVTAARNIKWAGFCPIAAFTPLTQHILATNAELRSDAAGCLPEYLNVYTGFPRRALSNVLLALRDARPEVRKIAAVALGSTKIRQSLAMQALTNALNDTDKSVRDAASSALQRLNSLSTPDTQNTK
jgi:HEAT repeat protein